MKISYEMRKRQRLKVAMFGRLLLKVALFLGILGFLTTTFLPSYSQFGLVIAGFAAITAPFGVVLEMLFSKIGWSENLFIDILFNQASIIAAILGFLTGAFYIGFFIIYGVDSLFLLITSISALVLSMILLTLGLRLSR